MRILVMLAAALLICISGAAQASPYFKGYNFALEKPTETLLLLPEFRTYQQTTDYSCAAVCVQMLEAHAGRAVHSEAELIKLLAINPDRGVTTEQLTKFLTKQGWQVEKTSGKQEPNSYVAFTKFVEEKITNNLPICVESSVWGGHWRIIIGIDRRGNDNAEDDVLILADPMDIADDVRDGYTIVNAQQFFYSWFDGNLGAMRRIRQWVVAK